MDQRKYVARLQSKLARIPIAGAEQAVSEETRQSREARRTSNTNESDHSNCFACGQHLRRLQMKQLEISDHQFEICTNLLYSHEGQPTVVGYCRTACLDQETGLSHSLEMQRSTIMETVRRKFGDDFRLILISEIGPGKNDYLPGLQLTIKLIETGLAQHVAVYNHSRISRNSLTYYRFIDMLSRHQATLITPATEAMNLRAFAAPTPEQVHILFGFCLGGLTCSEIADRLNQHEEHCDA